MLGNIFSTIAPWLGRVSFAVWILRMTNRQWTRVTIWTCIVCTSISSAGFVIYFSASCKPSAKGAFSQFQSGYCWASLPTVNGIYITGAINTVVDLVLSILPAILVIRLRMPSKLKISCITILCISSLAAAASLIRTIELPKILRGGLENIEILNTGGAKLCLLWLMYVLPQVYLVNSITNTS